MCEILLPIKPKYSQDIFKGYKKYELRRAIPKKEVEKIYIYETYPTMKIVGEVSVKKTHTKELKKLWDLTRKTNSLKRNEFFEYFNGKEEGHAFEIASYIKYEVGISLSEVGIKHAPQGFIYAKNINIK